MTARRETFEALYRDNPDPWNFASSAYEREKYRQTLAALPAQRYEQGLELGCSIGVLTAELAKRCVRLTAVDVSSRALDMARSRCPAAIFMRAEVPYEWPGGVFNLIVVSEILYFLTVDEIDTCARRVMFSLAAGGDVVVVNWLGKCDTAIGGDVAADRFFAAACEEGALVRAARREPLYRIDVLTARDGRKSFAGALPWKTAT